MIGFLNTDIGETRCFCCGQLLKDGIVTSNTNTCFDCDVNTLTKPLLNNIYGQLGIKTDKPQLIREHKDLFTGVITKVWRAKDYDGSFYYYRTIHHS